MAVRSIKRQHRSTAHTGLIYAEWVCLTKPCTAQITQEKSVDHSREDLDDEKLAQPQTVVSHGQAHHQLTGHQVIITTRREKTYTLSAGTDT